MAVATVEPPPKVPSLVAVLLLRSTRKECCWADAWVTWPKPISRTAARMRLRILKQWLSVMVSSGKAMFSIHCFKLGDGIQTVKTDFVSVVPLHISGFEKPFAVITLTRQR